MAYYIWKSYKLSTPALKIFQVLSRKKNCFFLDSSTNSHALGRYSFLGAEPFYIFKREKSNPFADLRKELNRYKVNFPRNSLPFPAGAVGYFSYDLGFALEKSVKKIDKPGPGIPDCYFGFYNAMVVIDHDKQRLHILSFGMPEKRQGPAKLLAEENFKKILKAMEIARNCKLPKAGKSQARAQEIPESNFTKNNYIQAVKKAKEYIRKGDIYQVNLSQQFSAKTRLSGFEVYQNLRNTSPSNFSAYFDAGDFQVISSSPERFLKLKGDIVFTRPMKGTRPRAETPLKDKKQKLALLKSAKDKAELVMIVDLERNDLGRVCDYGTVQPLKLRQLEKYRTVFQTTATIAGSLYKNKDGLDLLEACLPGGSITGCPKIRAMEIIEELEPARRGIYTGSLGYISFSGDMDFNIMIRTILKKGSRISFGAGGGIVADSRPIAEYNETLAKAKGIFQAINAKPRGL